MAGCVKRSSSALWMPRLAHSTRATPSTVIPFVSVVVGDAATARCVRYGGHSVYIRFKGYILFNGHTLQCPL